VHPGAHADAVSRSVGLRTPVSTAIRLARSVLSGMDVAVSPGCGASSEA
jgi:hypothetical protein